MNRNRSATRGIGIGRACAIAGIAVLGCFSNVDARTITVLSGTYGANCGAPAGNATGDLVRQCDGRDTCQYVELRSTGRQCDGRSRASMRWPRYLPVRAGPAKHRLHGALMQQGSSGRLALHRHRNSYRDAQPRGRHGQHARAELHRAQRTGTLSDTGLRADARWVGSRSAWTG